MHLWGEGGKSSIHLHCVSHAKRGEGVQIRVKLRTYLMEGPISKLHLPLDDGLGVILIFFLAVGVCVSENKSE